MSGENSVNEMPTSADTQRPTGEQQRSPKRRNRSVLIWSMLGAIIAVLAVLVALWWFLWRVPNFQTIAEECRNPIPMEAALVLVDAKGELDAIMKRTGEGSSEEAIRSIIEVEDSALANGRHPNVGLSPSSDGLSLRIRSQEGTELTGKQLRNENLVAIRDLVNAIRDVQVTGVVACVNSKLSLPESILDRMVATTALDGTQEIDRNGITVSWTYHPNQGLNVLYERG